LKKNSLLNWFDVLSTGITLSVVAFIATALFSIIVGGIPYISEAFHSPEIRFSMGLSLYTSTLSTLFCILLAIPCGYSLTRVRLPFKNIMQVIIEMPLSLPYLVLGLCLLIMFSSPFGKALRDIGFPVVFNKNGIIMAQIIVNLPFAIRLIRTEIGKLDSRLEFIAGTLGASCWQRFTTIILPQCKVSLLMAVILVWSRALGEFGATLMLVGVTRMKTETLPASIYLNISTGDNGMAMAAAMIMLFFSAITLSITALCNRKLQQKSRANSLTAR
jgi:molybdate transport system permease protein